MKTVTVYKVCSYEDGLLRSLSIVNARAVVYGFGIPTVPLAGCGPLAAFSNVFAAVGFILRCGLRRGLKLFKAKAVLSEESSLYFTARGGSSLQYTARGESYRYTTDMWVLPIGTVLCSSITLLKEIHNPLSWWRRKIWLLVRFFMKVRD